MKKIVLILTIIAAIFTAIACDINNDSADKNQIIKADSKGLNPTYSSVASSPEYDGSVNSYTAVNTTDTTMAIGSTTAGMISRGIITFDTRNFPVGREIKTMYVKLFFSDRLGCGGTAGDWDLGNNALAFEFAPSYGFSYTLGITGADMWAAATTYVIPEAAFFFDAFMFYNKDGLNPHLVDVVNEGGYTQIRVSVNRSINTPCMLDIFTGEADASKKPALFVTYAD